MFRFGHRQLHHGPGRRLGLTIGALFSTVALVAGPVLAAGVSTSTMTVVAGRTATRTVTSVSGTVTVKSSATSVATVSYKAATSTRGSITVKGVKAGTATITLRDATRTAKVFKVTIKPRMTASPRTVTISVGSSATIKLANPNSSTITVTPARTAFFATTTPDGTTVVVKGRAPVNASPIVISDGYTKVTVRVTVSAAIKVDMTGQLLASNCFQCHGTNGSGGFDGIAGESASEIYGELKEFAASTSSNDIMAAHAAGFTDLQMRRIADYLSTLSK